MRTEYCPAARCFPGRRRNKGRRKYSRRYCRLDGWRSRASTRRIFARALIWHGIGRAVVNENLQLETHPEVFIAGDSAAAASASIRHVVAPVAIDHGGIAAVNIVHHMRNEPLDSYRFVSKGMLVSLGMNYAVVNVGGDSPERIFRVAFLERRASLQIGWLQENNCRLWWTGCSARFLLRDAAIVRPPKNCPYCQNFRHDAGRCYRPPCGILISIL